MTKPDKNQYKTISFDVYGTLIDWENGILGYLQPLLESYDVHVIDEWVLELYADYEPACQAEGGSYRSVLMAVLEKFGCRLAFSPNEEALAGFPASMEYWQPFEDTRPALEALSAGFDLAILSNVDDDLFQLTRPSLGVDFDHVITAEAVGAYKPDPAMFNTLVDTVEGPLLHVAQSRFHDIAPASELGIDTVWVNREGAAATKASDARPKWTVSSLTELADLLT